MQPLLRYPSWALLASFICGPVAAADLTGHEITVSWLYPTTSHTLSTDVVTVDSGVEIPCPGAANICGVWANGTPDTLSIAYDIGANTISFFSYGDTRHGTAPFNGFQFSGLDAGGAWSGATLSTNIADLSSPDTRLSFDGATLRLNVSSVAGITDGSYWTVTLVSAVPEPETYALMLTGLALVVGVAKRRQIGVAARRTLATT